MVFISKAEFTAFTIKWKEGPKTQRFGQAFLNTFKFACPHETDTGPCIFHEADTTTAYKWIQRNAVDWGT